MIYYTVFVAVDQGILQGERLLVESSHQKQCHSPTCKRAANSTKVLLDLVPRNFSTKYRNPCWYSSLHIPHVLSDYFHDLTAIHSPLVSGSSRNLVPAIQRFKFLSTVRRKSVEPSLYCLPFVHLASFPKCGTTALYQMLIRHPLIAEPVRKEGHFWSTFTDYTGTYEDKFLHGLWYLHQFQTAASQIAKSPNSITIDASPSTLWKSMHKFEEESDMYVLPSAINEVTPTARFIVIMRDPIKRLFSDFWYSCSYQNWVISHHAIPPNKYFHNVTVKAILHFNDCVTGGIASLYYDCVRGAIRWEENNRAFCYRLRLGIGMYYYHIIRWLRVIPRERFMFLRSEDLSRDPFSTLERVWSFLDLPRQTRQEVDALLATRHEWNTNDWIKSERYRERFAMLPETERILREFYRPHNEKLAELLSDPHYLWRDND